jgi:hypothetical protein
MTKWHNVGRRQDTRRRKDIMENVDQDARYFDQL